MAASANSIKKVMDLVWQSDGTLDMHIHLQMRPDKHGYVEGRPAATSRPTRSSRPRAWPRPSPQL
jgi:hypothetical protein